MRRSNIKYAAVVIASAAALVAGCGTGQDGNQQGQGAPPPPAPATTPGGMGAGEGQEGQGQEGQAGQGQPGDVEAAKTELQTKLDSLQQGSPITFAPDSADLTEEGRQSVSQAAELLKQAPQELRFEVTGYTASVSGSGMDSQQLSQQRAQTVADELGKAGIAADRLQVTGKGDASGDPEAARRAEIKPI